MCQAEKTLTTYGCDGQAVRTEMYRCAKWNTWNAEWKQFLKDLPLDPTAKFDKPNPCKLPTLINAEKKTGRYCRSDCARVGTEHRAAGG
jgi:hypothetical protein